MKPPVESSFAVLDAATANKGRPAPAGADPEAFVMTLDKNPRAMAQRTSSSRVTEMSVTQAVDPILQQLADELQRCRRYHEATFPSVLVDRLVFVGGEAHNRPLCQALARRLSIAAQIGDPVGGLTPEVTTRRSAPDLSAAGIDPERQQPGWAVACGLSLGAPA